MIKRSHQATTHTSSFCPLWAEIQNREHPQTGFVLGDPLEKHSFENGTNFQLGLPPGTVLGDPLQKLSLNGSTNSHLMLPSSLPETADYLLQGSKP